MRQIKFRAWNKEHKNMTYFLLEEVINLTMQNIAVLGYLRHNFEKKKIMQYTGLKDKNDKEIYEDDIIRWEYPTGESEIFVMKFGELGWYLDYHGEFEGLATSEIKELVVIGNIYENSELLK